MKDNSYDLVHLFLNFLLKRKRRFILHEPSQSLILFLFTLLKTSNAHNPVNIPVGIEEINIINKYGIIYLTF